MINKNYDYVLNGKKIYREKSVCSGLVICANLPVKGFGDYANGWYWNPSGKKGWFYGDMEKSVMDAFREQEFKFDKGYSSGYRNTDHHYYCTELKMSYSVDSSD